MIFYKIRLIVLRKAILVLLLLIFFGSFAKAQKGVERSLFGLQVGLPGVVYFNNETKISNLSAIRIEMGIDNVGIWASELYIIDGFKFGPVFTLEPRYYYNIRTRQARNRETGCNSGNFVAIQSSYHPDWFYISNSNSLKSLTSMSIIPTWGIKRQLGRVVRGLFTYELGFGVGYRYVFTEKAGWADDYASATFNFHIRLGLQAPIY